MKSVRLRPLARTDLKSILNYFETEGVSDAKKSRFVACFEETCSLLAKYPEFGRKDSTIEAPSAFSEMRRFPIRHFPRYLILYTDQPSVLLISRVIHGARDPKLRTVDPL